MAFTPHEDQNTKSDFTDAEVDDLFAKTGVDEYDGGDSKGPTINDEAPEVEAAPEKQEAAPAVTPDPVAAKPAEPVVPKEQEYEITYKGHTIKAPLSKVLKWAQMGYDAPQREAEFSKREQAIKAIETTYGPIDEWVKANPEKWEKIQGAITQEQNGFGDLPANHPIVQRLLKIEETFNQKQQQERTATQQKEDQELETEVKSIREKYKDLDWASADELGRSAMEVKVLMHADKHKMTFKSAFADLYLDDLLKSAETRAREQFAATKERQAKAGILPKGAPTTLVAPKKTNSKAYESTEDILKELNLG